MTTEWSDVWPTKKGFYWFYGVTSNYDEKPALYYVKVRNAQNGHALYITEGRFLFQSERAKGQWMPVALPELPNH